MQSLALSRPIFLGETDRSPEAELVRRAQEGEMEAFEDLVRGLERQVFATAWKMLGEREEARDAVQEVFLRLFRSLERVDPERPLGAWVHRIAVNVCRDLGSRRARRAMQPLAGGMEETLADPSPDADPLRRAAARQARRRLADALRRLPERECLALVLRDVQGLTTREVAREMGSSEVTVRSQISRARLKLRRWRREAT